MIDRSEKLGLAIAAAGHVGLFGLLSVGFLATPNPLKLESKPVEVALVDEIALESMSPNPHSEEVAAKLAPEDAPLEPENAPPEAVEQAPEPIQPEPAPPKPVPPKPTPPKPAPKPEPAPAPKPAPKAPPPKPSSPPPAAKAAPKAPPKAAAPAPAAKASPKAPTKPTGRLDGILGGLSDKPTPSKATTPPAATVGPQVKGALAAEVLRQIKPRWSPPSGADSEKLRTTVEVRLNQDGSIAGEPQVTQTGVTPGNRVQAELHRERAIRAVRLAAPFKLPAQYYEAWKVIAPTLYEGL